MTRSSRAHHLHHDLFAVVQDSAVHLGNGCGRQRFLFESLDASAEQVAQGRFDDGPGIRAGEGRHMILQLGKFVGEIGWQQVSPCGQQLAELDEDGPEFLEEQAQAHRRDVTPSRHPSARPGLQQQARGNRQFVLEQRIGREDRIKAMARAAIRAIRSSRRFIAVCPPAARQQPHFPGHSLRRFPFFGLRHLAPARFHGLHTGGQIFYIRTQSLDVLPGIAKAVAIHERLRRNLRHARAAPSAAEPSTAPASSTAPRRSSPRIGRARPSGANCRNRSARSAGTAGSPSISTRSAALPSGAASQAARSWNLPLTRASGESTIPGAHLDAAHRSPAR